MRRTGPRDVRQSTARGRPAKAFVLAVLMILGAPAGAEGEGPGEVPRGLWKTPPDGLGVVLLVRTRACGPALCGRVERALNRGGYDAPSSAVGAKVLQGLRPQPDGSFLGTYAAPGAFPHPARAILRGRDLRLEACRDNVCSTEVWSRIR